MGAGGEGDGVVERGREEVDGVVVGAMMLLTLNLFLLFQRLQIPLYIVIIIIIIITYQPSQLAAQYISKL
ncbi:hypothetical protein FN846DRAFT_963473 [Sphaerosporella brunnea]|uniref:Uncharacterized protein n=1 Tax=Sphaerosporella brunnea TaxID=1250544 RepID=A0A5J5EMB6_9PEZI|nr:hypothetical protein FN846DRAFT_963473 [Sphaerosporella brunnea]